MMVEASRDRGSAVVLVIVARLPHRDMVNWTENSVEVGVKIGSTSNGHLVWKSSGVVKENPGGMVVTAGQRISK